MKNDFANPAAPFPAGITHPQCRANDPLPGSPSETNQTEMFFTREGQPPEVPRNMVVKKERAARDAGMKRAEENNEPSPNDRAIADMIAAIEKLPPGSKVAADVLLPDLDLYGFSTGRAAGPLMIRLGKMGWLTRINEFRESERERNHRGTIRVWLTRRPEAGQ